MNYLPLFNVQILHNFYQDGFCPDFTLEPTAATRKLLTSHRCVLKIATTGFRVAMQVNDDNEPLIPLAPTAVFTVQMRLRNPEFGIFTDLTQIAGLSVPVFSNVAATAPTDVMVPVEITAQDRLPTPPATTITPLANGVFAELEIVNNNTLPVVGNGPAHFQVKFTSKKALWKYYIVTDSTNNDLQIEDGSTSPIVFGPGNRRNLIDNPDPDDAIALALAKKYPTLQRWRFVSDQEVEYRNAPRKMLHLQLGPGESAEKVITALPNPPLGNLALAPPADGQTELKNLAYQIVTYFSHQVLNGG